MLGQAWGAHAIEFLRDHPKASLVLDEADVQDYELPEPVSVGGQPLEASFQFQLDALVAVRLDLPRAASGELDIDQVRAVIATLADAFSEPLEDDDEGLLVAEEASTRMSIDLLDGEILFEDLEA